MTGVDAGGEAFDLAVAAAADQIEHTRVAHNGAERAAEQPVVDRALGRRQAKRSIEGAGYRMRRGAGAVQVGIDLKLARREPGLAYRGKQRRKGEASPRPSGSEAANGSRRSWPSRSARWSAMARYETPPDFSSPTLIVTSASAGRSRSNGIGVWGITRPSFGGGEGGGPAGAGPAATAAGGGLRNAASSLSASIM